MNDKAKKALKYIDHFKAMDFCVCIIIAKFNLSARS